MIAINVTLSTLMYSISQYPDSSQTVGVKFCIVLPTVSVNIYIALSNSPKILPHTLLKV